MRIVMTRLENRVVAGASSTQPVSSTLRFPRFMPSSLAYANRVVRPAQSSLNHGLVYCACVLAGAELVETCAWHRDAQSPQSELYLPESITDVCEACLLSVNVA